MGPSRLLPALLLVDLLSAALPAAAAAPPAALEFGTPAGLRAAIADLRDSFGPRYPGAAGFLRRLDEIEPRLVAADPAVREATARELAGLRRQALTASPLLRGVPILYVVRPQYWGSHGPINTTFENGEILAGGFRGGSALKVLTLPDGPGPEAATRTLVEAPEGVVRDPDVHFDARRVVFSLRRNPAEDYSLWEVAADGQGLRRLTKGSLVTDTDPICLPDDRIAFNSLRDLKYCQCNRHPMGNLFTMDADGANVVRIGGNNLWEGHPSLLPDGRILYSRWEYVDRQFGPSFGLWTCNPDGTAHTLCYGNNAWAPGAILDGQAIPGTSRIICTFGSCHDMPWGALAVLDRRLGLDGSEPVLHLWPPSTRGWITHQDNVGWHPTHIDLFMGTRPRYEDPYPLSERTFLVSRTLTEDTGPGMRMGLFLVDVFGNEVLLHVEGAGCYDPRPLVPRPRPPRLPARVDFSRDEGVFALANVYDGDGMSSLPRGTVRRLRVIEAPPKRAWSPAGGGGIDADQAPLMNWNLVNNKRILGDVPVEPDGSAHFTVPANIFLYFQALDERGQMVQSMRSGTFVQPGERAGCTGCHEHRHASPAPPVTALPAAFRRPPSRLQPWYGPPRDFNYLTEVQPVFDRHCVRCHDYGKEAGEQLNLAGDLGLLFNTSYLELHRRSAVRWSPDPPGPPRLLIKAVHDGPPAVLPPYAWGSHRSRLVEVLRQGHQGVTLSPEELDRIVTWIDLNAPYYGSYCTVFPDHPWGRSPLDQARLNRLAVLAGRKLDDFKHDPALQVSFTRPEVSPLLRRLGRPGDPAHDEALGVLRHGAAVLRQTPREDLLGPAARPRSPADVERQRRFERWSRQEGQARQAVRTGGKFYPSPDD